MELNPWIESVSGSAQPGRVSGKGVRVVAALLGESPRAVYSWYRRERAPSFRSALNIVTVSAGAVDWNGIYSPFAPPARDCGDAHAAN